MGGGKSSTTTQSVSIPPEVMARYNAVNQRAEQVASQPFQKYEGQFVAGLGAQQQAGMQGVNQAANQAQSYYNTATNQLQNAYTQGYGQTQAAYQPLQQGYTQGQQYAGQAANQYGQAYQAAQPYYQDATSTLESGLTGAGAANQGAMTAAQAAPGAAAGMNQFAQEQITGAQGQAAAGNQAAMEQFQGAAGQAGAANQFSQQQIFGAQQQAQAANQAAMAQAMGATGASSPYYQAATSGIGQALAAGQPYQGLATNAAMAGSQSVGPQALDVNAYMNPYTQQVAATTLQALQQQQQQEMSSQTGNAIRSGAFGGDRAGLVAANLARQQSLATAQAMAPIYQQGYAQALAAAQQQQGVGLSAAQADRAAQQQLAQQALAIGQQGYGQQMGAAQQQAALGQALFNQGVAGSQNLSNLGQTQYAQALGAGTAAGQLAQQLFGQNITGGQAMAQLAQNQYAQALGAGTAGAQLGQQLYGQGAQQAQLLSGLGQTEFGQNLAASQQQAALGQGQAALGMQYGQALQGLGQQQFAQGQGMSAQQAALAQQGYGMGAGTSAAMANLGTGAQNAALQGAQAQIAAGTLEQQTRQAELTAKYQEFLQERGFPYQQAQFLANIAMGTGALSGSTTTTQTPTGFFSDERLKEDAEQIGKTNDGQPIYRFRYKGDPRYQIGLMAQEVAQDHPEAVGKSDGYLTVDYKVATDDAVKRAEGGLVPNWMGGAVDEPGHYAEGGLVPRQGYASGSTVQDSDFMKAILQSQLQSFGPFSGGGPYGGAGAGTPGDKASGYVPKATLPVSKLVTASPIGGGGQQSGLSQAASTGKSIADLLNMGETGYQRAKKFFTEEKKADPNAPKGGQTVTKTEPAGGSSAPIKVAPKTESGRSGGPVSHDTGKGEGAFYIPGTNPDEPGSMVPASGGVIPVESMEDADKLVRQVEPEDIFFAAGGVVPRLGYAGLGKVIDPYEMQNPAEGIGGYIEDAVEEAEDTSDDKLPGTGGSGGAGKGRGIGDDIKDAAGLASSLYGAGKAVAAIASFLPFSDERLKDNIEKVGELHDGQNVYRYDFGNGRTQLGLLAQEVLKKKPEAVGKRDGYLTVDYDKATEGAIKRAMGGMARHGYALEGEVVDQPEVDGGGGADEAAPAAPTYDIKKALTVLKQMETGSPEGNYRKEHPEITYKSGEKDRAYGAFGVMGKNVPVWTEKYYGKRLTPQEFLDNPDAQNAVAEGEFGSYLQKHGNLGDAYSLWHSGVDLNKARAQGRRDINIATTDYVNKALGYYGGQEMPKSVRQSDRADMPSEKGAPVEYAGGDAASGFSIPGGEKFWVPALSMVGSMLASRNPTLGGAIGEGLVGGVAGYQAQQKLSAELAKNVLDIVRDRFNVTTDQKTGETRYFNKSTGELLSPGQFKQVVAGMARGLNVDPAVLGIVEPKSGGFNIPGGVGQPVPSIQAPGTSAAPGAGTTPQGTQPRAPAGAPAAPGTTEQAPAVEDITRMNKPQLQDDVMKNPQKYKLTGDRDPNYLTQQITDRKQRALNASNQGNATEASRLDAEAKDLEDRRKQILEDAVDLQYKTNVALQDAQTKSYNDYLTEAHKRQVAYVNVRKDMKRLADLYATDITPERLQGLKTEVTDIAASLGVNVFSREFENAAFDEAMKIALMQAAKQVDQLGLTRAPGAAMENTIKTVPAPLLAKGAAYALVGRTIGDLDYWANVDKNFLKEPRGTSPTEYLITYNDKYKDETPEKYIKRAFENDVRPVKGMDRRNIESIRRSYNVERIPGAEPVGAPAGGQAQPAAPAAPPVPEPLRGSEGLVYSPSRNQYRDAQGNIYDASGRRVQ